VKNFGLLIELPDVLLTGLVHISSLNDDFYTFNPAQRRFSGRHTKRRFSVGDQLRVYVARVDVFKRQVDFAIAEAAKPSGARRRR
jgi:ribonuclease R